MSGQRFYLVFVDGEYEGRFFADASIPMPVWEFPKLSPDLHGLWNVYSMPMEPTGPDIERIIYRQFARNGAMAFYTSRPTEDMNTPEVRVMLTEVVQRVHRLANLRNQGNYLLPDGGPR